MQAGERRRRARTTSRADASGEIRLPADAREPHGPLPDARRDRDRRRRRDGPGDRVPPRARAASTDVVVLERGYLAEGASGRNGGGVRQQWSTEINIRLMQESVELCRRFAVELGVNVWFRQGGYLFLARSAKEVARLEKNVALQNRCGVPTRMLEPDEAREHRARARPRPASSAPRTTRPTASCSRGRSCGATRARPPRTACGSSRRRRSTALAPQPAAASSCTRRAARCSARRVINAAGAWSPQARAR